MNLARNCLYRFIQFRSSKCLSLSLNNIIMNPPVALRSISITSCKLCEEVQSERPPLKNKEEGVKGHQKRETQVDESVQYMKSNAYKEIYGDEPVWRYYRRNHKGHFEPKPRISCTHRDKIITASPCPICRDDYLVVSYKNLDLLNQFLSSLTGEVLNPKQTGICMRQQKKLELELARAQDYGILEKHLTFRTYDNVYYQQLAKEKLEAMKSGAYNNEQSAPANKQTAKGHQSKTGKKPKRKQKKISELVY